MTIPEQLHNFPRIGFRYDALLERPVLEDPAKFFRFVVNRDTTYMYSDDHSVWKAGEENASLEAYVVKHCAKAAELYKIIVEYMKLAAAAKSVAVADTVQWNIAVYAHFEREFLEYVKHPCVEIVDILSEGTGDLSLAEKNLNSLKLMVNHIDDLAKKLSEKLVNWKPSTPEVFWDDIHVPAAYHQELRVIMDYFSKELLRDGINIVLGLLVGTFKYLQVNDFFRKAGFSKKPGPPGYRVSLLVPGTPYRYVIRRLS